MTCSPEPPIRRLATSAKPFSVAQPLRAGTNPSVGSSSPVGLMTPVTLHSGRAVCGQAHCALPFSLAGLLPMAVAGTTSLNAARTTSTKPQRPNQTPQLLTNDFPQSSAIHTLRLDLYRHRTAVMTLQQPRCLTHRLSGHGPLAAGPPVPNHLSTRRDGLMSG